MLRVLIRLLADAALIGVLLFVSAGTLVWWRAWVLLAVLLVERVATAVMVYRVNPDLLRDRARPPFHSDQSWADRILLSGVIMTGFVGLPIVAAIDVTRWHLLPRPIPLVASVGLLLFVIGWAVKGLALRENAFATSVVRLQRERAHVVIDTGVYAMVRHPFYAGTPLVFVGLSLWLESYAAAICAIVPISFLLMRIESEERFLVRELAGYREYVTRVRFRLLPGLW